MNRLGCKKRFRL